MWMAVSGVLLLLPPPCASRLFITSSGCAAGLYKGRRREAEDEEEERGGYVRYRVLPPEWAPRIHMIPSLLSLNYSRNCLAFVQCL